MIDNNNNNNTSCSALVANDKRNFLQHDECAQRQKSALPAALPRCPAAAAALSLCRLRLRIRLRLRRVAIIDWNS